MNLEFVAVMYVGSQERGRALQAGLASCGWHVYLPASTMEALATYIVYYPGAVILDVASDCQFSEEVYFHLHSVQAEALLMLCHDGQEGQWESVLPATATTCEIMMALSRLIEKQPRRW